MSKKTTILASAAFALTVSFSTQAPAKPNCGWYAIAYCSTSEDAAEKFVNGGWGQLIDTNKYDGFKHGLYCVVSGPQPKLSAVNDKAAARDAGIAGDVYIKKACTDESNAGD